MTQKRLRPNLELFVNQQFSLGQRPKKKQKTLPPSSLQQLFQKAQLEEHWGWFKWSGYSEIEHLDGVRLEDFQEMDWNLREIRQFQKTFPSHSKIAKRFEQVLKNQWKFNEKKQKN